MNQQQGMASPPLIYMPTQVLLKTAVCPLAINALDPGFQSDARNQLLSFQFRHVTYQDAQASGNLVFSAKENRWVLRTTRPLESFKGLVFEAAVARMCRDNPFTIGRKAFAWCTNQRLNRVSETLMSQYIPFITADQRLLDQKLTALFYNSTSPYDLQFYKVNQYGCAELATLGNMGVIAGIQIKAIRGNEWKDIVEPLIKGRYPHVLTMLKHESGIHSYEVCHQIVRDMSLTGKITSEQAMDVISRITHPEELGIGQNYIDSYSAALDLFHSGRAPWDHDSAVLETIALEVVDNLQRSPTGLLLPADPNLILPPTLN